MTLDLENALQTSPLSEVIAEFWVKQRECARQELEQSLQRQIEALEKQWQGARQIRQKNVMTPLGRITLRRRAYLEQGRYICLADRMLGIPENGWLSCFEKLVVALGVSTEFPNACKLLEDLTGICMSEHGMANRVEALGEELLSQWKESDAEEIYPLDSALSRTVCKIRLQRPVVYLQADGIHVPLNQAQKTKEARVGVVFWETERIRLSAKRREIRRREYAATLEGLPVFKDLLYKAYARVVGKMPCQPVFVGDGAGWLWSLAEEYYPDAIQILDYYHVSEYVWDVARSAYPENLKRQKNWVKKPLDWLKASQWEKVIAFVKPLQERSETVESAKALERYLRNNSSRIDYKRYLEMGLMIGSGVVESSNRRIVSQRLKQSGMHWSVRGANSVMALRACYLSSSDLWCQVWKQRAA